MINTDGDDEMFSGPDFVWIADMRPPPWKTMDRVLLVGARAWAAPHRNISLGVHQKSVHEMRPRA
jgi:hypothetical protein